MSVYDKDRCKLFSDRIRYHKNKLKYISLNPLIWAQN